MYLYVCSRFRIKNTIINLNVTKYAIQQKKEHHLHVSLKLNCHSLDFKDFKCFF